MIITTLTSLSYIGGISAWSPMEMFRSRLRSMEGYCWASPAPHLAATSSAAPLQNFAGSSEQTAATHWELELDFKISSKPNHSVILITPLHSCSHKRQHKHQGPITAGATSLCPQTGAPQAIEYLAGLTHSEGQFNWREKPSLWGIRPKQEPHVCGRCRWMPRWSRGSAGSHGQDVCSDRNPPCRAHSASPRCSRGSPGRCLQNGEENKQTFSSRN